jgi:DNA-binding IscR family transcriptional regulator
MKQFSVERASDNLTFPGDMSDSQKFPVAAHALAYLAHKEAFSADRAVASAELAASVPTNPVVVRRVTAMLGKAGLIGARAGANGGAWLLKPADSITLDVVLKAVHGCAHLGVAPKGVKGCPVGEKIPDAVRAAIGAADRAAHERLAQITVADLLNGAHKSAAVA